MKHSRAFRGLDSLIDLGGAAVIDNRVAAASSGVVGRFKNRLRYQGRAVATSIDLISKKSTGGDMVPVQAFCEQCNKTVDAKTLLSENELWERLNKGDEIEVMHLADDVHHTWKLTGQDQDKLRKGRAAGTA
jgi:hypothetical protein